MSHQIDPEDHKLFRVGFVDSDNNPGFVDIDLREAYVLFRKIISWRQNPITIKQNFVLLRVLPKTKETLRLTFNPLQLEQLGKKISDYLDIVTAEEYKIRGTLN